MTYNEMIKLLSEGRVDLSKFGTKGMKTLSDLYREIKERDVVLVKSDDGRIFRTAYSTKVVIFGGRTPQRPDRILLETSRTFPDGTKVKRLCPWGLSETRKRDESSIAAGQAGLWEEFRLVVGRTDLVQLSPLYVAWLRECLGLPKPEPPRNMKLTFNGDDYEEGESSVYPLLSARWLFWLRYVMPADYYHWSGNISEEPGGMRVVSRWYSMKKYGITHTGPTLTGADSW